MIKYRYARGVADLSSRVLVEADATPERVEHVLSMARKSVHDPDVELIRALSTMRDRPAAVARQLVDDANHPKAGS